jgi:3-oxoacyl-(acyl-carrier-protein) synthase
MGLLRNKKSDAVLVCGADELTEPLLAGLKALRVLSNTETLTPFDRKRNGMVLGEGAASLVIERAGDAEKRGATILGYIRGFGAGSDNTKRLHYSGSESMARTIESALKESDVFPDFVSASANSTKELDKHEALAIKTAIGIKTPVTALKSQVGSFMSSGIMKIAASMVSIGDDTIPPVFGLEEPEVQGLNYVMKKPLTRKVDSCIINGFSHGGSNMCIVVSGTDR